MALVQRVLAYIRRNGVAYTLRRAGQMAQERLLHSYDRSFRRKAPTARELACQRVNQPMAGCIGVVIPVYNTKPQFLQELAASLLNQTYADWQAVLYDGCSSRADTLDALQALPEDPRLLIVHGEKNEGISGNTNQAVAHCGASWIALCDHDDLLAPDALWRVARAIEQESPDMIYTDEDKLTEDGRLHTDPHCKPDFSPDNLRSGNYICHLMVIRRTLWDEIGGLRPDFDGSQDHDLALRASEHAKRIVHIPHILYHWRTVGTSMSHQHLAKCQDAAARAVTEHMERVGWPGVCSVEDGTLRLRYQVRQKTVATIVTPREGRFAYMNRMARNADEDVLFFVDEGIALPGGPFLQELLMYAQRDDVAAVTPQLATKGGRVFTAGYDVQDGKLIPRFRGLPSRAGGWHGMNRTSHNVDAVSSLCFMIRRDHFTPFPEENCGDAPMAEWCAAMYRRGLRCVYTPHAVCVVERLSMLAVMEENSSKFHKRG